MSNAKRNIPQVTQGGVYAIDKMEKHIESVSLSFAPVYHALNENATILPAAKAPFTQANFKMMERHHVS